MSRERRQTTQSVAWFRDLYNRDLLDLNPPYQRRSVWNQAYKDYFLDTVLLHYPAPAIFLYEEISPDGTTSYAVVDGKQRLSTLFEFADGDFPVSDKCPIERIRGSYFSHLTDDDKKTLWSYQFSVEYLPTTDENTLNNMFDRLNRNVARLTPQELRHARFSGQFITTAEELTEDMISTLPKNFPRISGSAQRQMKDVEFVSQLLLLTEVGLKSYSQDELDQAFSERDTEWPDKQQVESEFKSVIEFLATIPNEFLNNTGGRLRNQADFYSLYGALLELGRSDSIPSVNEFQARLGDFFEVVSDEQLRSEDGRAARYFEAARSASNDLSPRTIRIEIISAILTEK